MMKKEKHIHINYSVHMQVIRVFPFQEKINFIVFFLITLGHLPKNVTFLCDGVLDKKVFHFNKLK